MNSKNTITISSDVSAVTVYTDRALVTRTAGFTAEAGERKYIFDNLPDSIEQNSIQVNGTGEALLRDVKFSEVYFSNIPDDKVKALDKELEELADDLVAISDKIEQAEKEKAFVESIATKLTAQTREANTGQLDPDKWVKMVEFYRSKMVELDHEIRQAEQQQRKLEDEQERIDNTLASLGNSEKIRNRVEVIVDVSKTTDITLDLSYIVHGPGWSPYYDLRVNSETKNMNVIYNAMIRQTTSESWDDVSISLSTAQPSISGQQPELSPWYLEKYVQNEDIERTRNNKTSVVAKRKEGMAQMMSVEATDLVEEMIMAAPMIARPTSRVESMATSVVFVIAGKSSISNDGDDHKVTIMMQDFPAIFRYSCVPKHSTYAYLKAQIKNTTDYPFLSGPTNIFLDNNFVSNAHMDLVAPNEEFWTYLGIDEGIKIEHKFLKRHQKQAGVFSKTNNFIYEYLIEVTNNKKTMEDIVVWDQLPVSNHEKIEVKLMSPVLKENDDVFKMNEFKYLEWLYQPNAGEKFTIPLKFSVEYPQEMNVTGL